MRIALALALLLLAAVACGGSDSPITSQTPQASGCPALAAMSPDTHTIRIATAEGISATLTVELADTFAERGTGLMNRTCLPDDSGMLFAFPSDTTIGFFMKDTPIPLSIAFIQADGKIVHIVDMQPETTTNHASPVPYRYAIEVSQGWFAENGVAIGDTAAIPAQLSASAT